MKLTSSDQQYELTIQPMVESKSLEDINLSTIPIIPSFNPSPEAVEGLMDCIVANFDLDDINNSCLLSVIELNLVINAALDHEPKLSAAEADLLWNCVLEAKERGASSFKITITNCEDRNPTNEEAERDTDLYDGENIISVTAFSIAGDLGSSCISQSESIDTYVPDVSIQEAIYNYIIDVHTDQIDSAPQQSKTAFLSLNTLKRMLHTLCDEDESFPPNNEAFEDFFQYLFVATNMGADIFAIKLLEHSETDRIDLVTCFHRLANIQAPSQVQESVVGTQSMDKSSTLSGYVLTSCDNNIDLNSAFNLWSISRDLILTKVAMLPAIFVHLIVTAKQRGTKE